MHGAVPVSISKLPLSLALCWLFWLFHPNFSSQAILSLCLADSFTRQVLWTLLNDVKFGEAVSYKQLAELAGNSRAARAVGGAMRSNPVSAAQSCWDICIYRAL